MPLTRITYTDKEDRRSSALATINKCTAADLNEIKTVVNALCDTVDALEESARPYLVYVAMLNQSGTNAPTATVLENTLGGEVVWTYSSVGAYLASLVGAFTENKTMCFAPQNDSWTSLTVYAMSRASSNFVQLNTGILDATTGEVTASNGRLYNDFSYIEIRVYP